MLAAAAPLTPGSFIVRIGVAHNAWRRAGVIVASVAISLAGRASACGESVDSSAVAALKGIN